MISYAAAAGILALGIGVSSYLLRTHVAMLLTAAASAAVWGLHFHLQGAPTAALMSAVMSVRIAAGVYTVHWNARARRLLTFAVGLGICAGASMTWEGLQSLPSALASLLLAYAGLNLKYHKIRPALLGAELLWLWNGLVIGSNIGVVGACFGLAVNLGVMWQERRTPLPPLALD